MTEQEWAACEKPQPMLECLRKHGRLSGRRSRLFACACVRRIWTLVRDGICRKAVTVAERYAEGTATQEELRAAYEAAAGRAEGAAEFAAASTAKDVTVALPTPPYSAQACDALTARAVADVLRFVAENAAEAAADAADEALYAAARRREVAAQCGLLRCLFGSPFQAVPPSDGSLLTWNGGVIRRLAQAAYDDRRMPEGTLDCGRLGILADALEEAGADTSLLGHLRSPGPHVRGCDWVDWLLGKF